MYQQSIKYLSVTLLILLFTMKGLVSFLPLLSDISWPDQQEMKLNTQSENTEENTGEKQVEIKEFLGHFYNAYSSLKYALTSKTIPPRYAHFKTDVFLPVNTPPPKQLL